jgi:hypothetical protein
MSKKNKNIEVAVVESTIEVITKRPGRPVNPDSERQQRLRGELKSEGKRGRPVNPNSERQQRLALMQERRANGEVKRGRPSDPNSKRQQALQLKGSAAGKRGRPVNPNSERQQKIAAKVAADVKA